MLVVYSHYTWLYTTNMASEDSQPFVFVTDNIN